MRLLLALVARHDQVCTRAELLDELWPSPETTEASLTRAMSELRRALGDSRGMGRYIETIQRVGYKAVAPLAPLQSGSTGPPRDPGGQPLDSAQEMVALADYLIARRNADDLARAIGLLGEFAASEPGHAQVFAMLAYAERLMPLYREEPVGLRTAQSRAHAREALRLDGANGLAWAVLGGLAHDQWQWNEALREFERAVSFAPFDAYVLHGHAELLLHMGEVDNALAFMQRAVQVKPVSAAERMVLAWMLLHADDQRAAQELDMARRLGADSVFADNLECLLHHRAGWDEPALARWRTMDAVRRHEAMWIWSQTFMSAAAGASDSELAPAVFDELEAGRRDVGVALFQLACAGPLDAAFEVADRAVDGRCVFAVDPWLAETRRFRRDRRFAPLCRRIGLDPPPGRVTR